MSDRILKDGYYYNIPNTKPYFAIFFVIFIIIVFILINRQIQQCNKKSESVLLPDIKKENFDTVRVNGTDNLVIHSS